jgi:hypothetical protein
MSTPKSNLDDLLRHNATQLRKFDHMYQVDHYKIKFDTKTTIILADSDKDDDSSDTKDADNCKHGTDNTMNDAIEFIHLMFSEMSE